MIYKTLTYKKLSFLSALLFFSFLLEASSIPPPDIFVQNAINQVIDELEKNKDKIKTNPGFVKQKVENILVPLIDFTTMSKWILATHWRKANKAQRERFVVAFRRVLIDYYSGTLEKYESGKIVFLPYKKTKKKKEALIKSKYIPHQGEPIPINYYLMYSETRGWKIVNLKILGKSIVKFYRVNYKSKIKRMKGLENFLTALEKGEIKI